MDDEKGIIIAFGLEAQGHIETIEKQMKGWKSSDPKLSRYFWEYISKKIGWCPLSASLNYFKYLENKRKPINWQRFDPDNPPKDTEAEYLVEGFNGGIEHCHTTGKCFFVGGMIIDFKKIKAYAVITPSNF